ncbi:MAG: dihydropteroate synthase [Candidatus Heimdallarchaeaceae archaeon]
MIRGYLGKLEVGDNLSSKIVGVVNLSLTSFYNISIASTKQQIEEKVIQMITEGADCIDLGAQSTRPIQIYGGEGRVDEDTELSMIKESLKISMDILSSYSNVEVSIDTMRSKVTEYALKNNVRIINDISGFKKNEQVAKLIGEYNAHAVVMAARKEPGDVFTIRNIIDELQKSITIGVSNGIKEENILIDPGIGSWEARDYHHDYSIIKNLEDFRILRKPLYVGISRKTSVGKILNDAPPEERLYGSLGATIIAIANGAHVVRTHDIKPTLEAIRVAETIMNYRDD